MRNKWTGHGWWIGLFLLGLAGCNHKSDPSTPSAIAVGNSYLEAAVVDLGFDRSKIMSLVPPGMCPGHFDLKPTQADRLLSCTVLLVFDFQSNLSSSLPRVRESGLKIGVITPPPGLCVPASYLTVVRQTAAALASANLLSAEQSVSRLQSIEKRMKQLDEQVRAEVEQAGISGSRVVLSQHQEAFARRLGLIPVGTFRGRDTETPGSIQSALEKAGQNPAKWVIANRQEGTELAASLAKRLSVSLVVFGNFPETVGNCGDQPAFDSLVCENVRRLVEASR